MVARRRSAPLRASVEGVMVHYGDPTATRDALRALSSVEGIEFGLTLVNNGPEGFLSAFEEVTKEIRPVFRGDLHVVQPGTNLGYAGGLNYGIDAARKRNEREVDYFLLLNNDVIVSSPDTVAQLVEALDREPRAAAGRSGFPLGRRRGFGLERRKRRRMAVRATPQSSLSPAFGRCSAPSLLGGVPRWLRAPHATRVGRPIPAFGRLLPLFRRC